MIQDTYGETAAVTNFEIDDNQALGENFTREQLDELLGRTILQAAGWGVRGQYDERGRATGNVTDLAGGRWVLVEAADVQPGDIVSETRNQRRGEYTGHVGIVVEVNRDEEGNITGGLSVHARAQQVEENDFGFTRGPYEFRRYEPPRN